MTRIAHHRIVLPILGFCIYMAASTPYFGHWDSFDYLKQIVTHQLSSLGIGRPVYVGYNILLWESTRRIFSIEPLQASMVVMIATVLLGAIGIFIFQRLSNQLMHSPGGGIATVALVLSPVYALYSGLIMTEVPMLVTLLAAAVILWKPSRRFPALSDALSGLLFGLAVGIREQALTLGGAFVWILYSRGQTNLSRIRSALLFGTPATAAILVPAVALYLRDTGGFFERTETWFAAIPTGNVYFWNNVAASLLYTAAVCPASWIAVMGSGIYRYFHRHVPENTVPEDIGEGETAVQSIPHPICGIVCCLILPIVFLWRDADVQVHPRYLLVTLPASLILCTSLYRRWIPSRKGLVAWVAIHVMFFAAACAVLWPIRQIQIEKLEFADVIRESVSHQGLIIAGNYSPILDYYRAIGLRPQWRILWSGWNWNVRKVDAEIRSSWAGSIPVYLVTDSRGWLNFETEFLELYFMLKDCRKESIAPNLFLVYPPY